MRDRNIECYSWASPEKAMIGQATILHTGDYIIVANHSSTLLLLLILSTLRFDHTPESPLAPLHSVQPSRRGQQPTATSSLSFPLLFQYSFPPIITEPFPPPSLCHSQ